MSKSFRKSDEFRKIVERMGFKWQDLDKDFEEEVLGD